MLAQAQRSERGKEQKLYLLCTATGQCRSFTRRFCQGNDCQRNNTRRKRNVKKMEATIKNLEFSCLHSSGGCLVFGKDWRRRNQPGLSSSHSRDEHSPDNSGFSIRNQLSPLRFPASRSARACPSLLFSTQLT